MPTATLPISIVALLLFVGGCTGRIDAPAPPPATSASPQGAPVTQRVVGPLSAGDAAALATMNDRIRDYLQIHMEVEQSLPKLPADATPQQIDINQREFGRRLRERRAVAKAGDIFTPEARVVIVRLLASVFSGPDGTKLKASVLDENPANTSTFKPSVNTRYPDTVPVSTVPLQVLQTLPKLPEDMEYRFIGRSLIILDTHAHTIADFIQNVIPS